MFSMLDFVIKGSVGVFLFELFQVNPMLILCITLLMWILNFAVPSLVGSYFVLTFKPSKTL